MTTALEGPLKRALVVDGEPYTLTITPDGLNLAPKGRRKGHALAWRDLVSGEAALATALNASLHNAPAARARQPAATAAAPAQATAKTPKMSAARGPKGPAAARKRASRTR
jgi:hypothetical protein